MFQLQRVLRVVAKHRQLQVLFVHATPHSCIRWDKPGASKIQCIVMNFLSCLCQRRHSLILQLYGFSSPFMSSEPKQGWTPQPNGRGTWDILQSCIITIFLCCWTSVYPNIPPKGSSEWAKFYNKLILASIGVLGPEFVLSIALGQYSSARRSYKVPFTSMERFKSC